MDIKTIDNKIKSILKLRGLTVKTMCEFIGVSEQGYIYSIKNNSLRVDMLLKICSYLDVSVEELFVFGERNSALVHYNSLVDDIFIYSKQTIEKDLLKNNLFLKFCEKTFNCTGNNNRVILSLKELVKTAEKLKDASIKK